MTRTTADLAAAASPSGGMIDAGRLADLIASCHGRLRAFVARRAEPSEVDDVLQEVLANLVEADRKSPVEQVSAWLFRAVKNELIDRGRKRRERLLGDGEDADPDLAEISRIMRSPDPESELLKSLFWRELALALDELPEAQREVFVKTELEGATFKDLCRDTGLPLGTLLARKHRATVKLRRRLMEVRDLIVGS